MSVTKRRQRAGRLNKVFAAFINEQGLKTGEFSVDKFNGTWRVQYNAPPRIGTAGWLLKKENGHIYVSLAQGAGFPSFIGLAIRAARHCTGEDCFFSRNGVVYFKSTLLEVPYGQAFKIPNKGERV